MYYCIHLSDQHTGTIDQNGTNTVRSVDTKQGNATLTWQLLDNSTVNKFVDITKSVALSDSRVIDWNYYRTDNISLPSLVEQLNSAIDAYPLPSDYKILLTDNKELVYEQTNRVHYAFEKLLVESNPSNKQKEILERLNKLVHEIEHNISNHFDNTVDTEHFIVCRHTCNESVNLYKKLTDEDYNRFIFQNETGDLFLDFFTVGKDLGHAFMSNDVELIKNKEIKQQSLITASVQIGVVEENKFLKYDSTIDIQQRKQYENWCQLNDVESYGYNYKEPMYNLGRCKLGTLVNETYQSFVNKLSNYPYITNVSIIDDI